MLTTQTEKQEVFDAIKGRMSVHQHSDSGNGGGHGGGHGHKSAMPKKAGMAHLSQQAIDTSWVFDQHYVINPRSYQRKAWDIMLTLLVFYLISLLPWQLGVPFYHAPKELYKFDTVLGMFCSDLDTSLLLCFKTSSDLLFHIFIFCVLLYLLYSAGRTPLRPC